MFTLSTKARLLLVLGSCCLSLAFSSSSSKPFVALPKNSALLHRPVSVSLGKRATPLLVLRGGEQEEDSSLAEDIATDEVVSEEVVTEEAPIDDEVAIPEDTIEEPADSPEPATMPTSKMPVLAPAASILQSLGSAYSTQLTNHPILTKSVTASFIFGLSDWTAQKLEGSSEEEDDKSKMNWTRIISASLVGLLYFGPAAHGWYETIFRILPKQSLLSTLQKAALGQLLFGPSFTCVFFATSLMQSGEFTIGSWLKKIKSDLPGAWAAGLGFWPLVDLFSYSVLPSRWIPLFVNVCSYVWTIYLSIVANKRASGAEAS